ncbi:MAG: hypothetical protein REI93_04115, partial [Pedobacter sp.]|nr:hypothetical protein [Pedobacter sp.]
MKIDELLEAIEKTMSKSKVIELAHIAAKSSYSVKDLIDLTFHADQQVGFRAAWILENLFSLQEARFLEHVSYFLEKFSDQENRSAQRHYVKILAQLSRPKAAEQVKKIWTTVDAGNLITTVFDWLIDPQTPVAIKSHALSILANLNRIYPWIGPELLQTIDFLIDKESIAFFA